jgi:hypothetical protein
MGLTVGQPPNIRKATRKMIPELKETDIRPVKKMREPDHAILGEGGGSG